jgi:hypothetical protein
VLVAASYCTDLNVAHRFGQSFPWRRSTITGAGDVKMPSRRQTVRRT